MLKLLLAATCLGSFVHAAVPGRVTGESTGSSIAAAAASLKSLIAGINGGAAPPTVSATIPSGASAAVAGIQRDMIAAATAFDGAAQAFASPDEKAFKAALRAATMSGSAGPNAGTSVGAASFLAAPQGKISLNELSSIGNAIFASASAHVPSKRWNSSCNKCTPNFSSCPVGWQMSRAGTCVPGANYNGFCNKSMALSAYSSAELLEAEAFCGICWPCA